MDITGLRYDGDTRRFMDATYHRHAEESGAPWAALQGPPQERLRTAVEAVAAMLGALRGACGADRSARAGAGARRGALSGSTARVAGGGRGLGLALERRRVGEERHERDAQRVPGDARDRLRGLEARRAGRATSPPRACDHAAVEDACRRPCDRPSRAPSTQADRFGGADAVRAGLLGRRQPSFVAFAERRVQLHRSGRSARKTASSVADLAGERRHREPLRTVRASIARADAAFAGCCPK